MPDVLLEKHITCPTCQRGITLFVDRSQFAIESRSGIVKRTYHHGNHYILLDIDTNGDIRSETSIEVKSLKDETVDSLDVLTWIELVRSTKREMTLLIVDNPDRYRDAFADLISSLHIDEYPFSFSKSETIEFCYSGIRILIKLGIEPFNEEKVDLLALVSPSEDLLEQLPRLTGNASRIRIYFDETHRNLIDLSEYNELDKVKVSSDPISSANVLLWRNLKLLTEVDN